MKYVVTINMAARLCRLVEKDEHGRPVRAEAFAFTTSGQMLQAIKRVKAQGTDLDIRYT